jgi:hypothetical protein
MNDKPTPARASFRDMNPEATVEELRVADSICVGIMVGMCRELGQPMTADEVRLVPGTDKTIKKAATMIAAHRVRERRAGMLYLLGELRANLNARDYGCPTLTYSDIKVWEDCLTRHDAAVSKNGGNPMSEQQSMSGERLLDIRQKLACVLLHKFAKVPDDMPLDESHGGLATLGEELIAEIDRLRAENAELRRRLPPLAPWSSQTPCYDPLDGSEVEP